MDLFDRICELHRILSRALRSFSVDRIRAVRALSAAHRLETTGFSRRQPGTFLTWPIWGAPVALDVARSMLSLQALQVETPPRKELMARGIIEVFRCQRITPGKYRHFTSAAPA